LGRKLRGLRVDPCVARAWKGFQATPQTLGLPTAPKPFLRYYEEDDRPQTRLDRDFERGMGVTIGEPFTVVEWLEIVNTGINWNNWGIGFDTAFCVVRNNIIHDGGAEGMRCHAGRNAS
jgi:hypothetical protein